MAILVDANGKVLAVSATILTTASSAPPPNQVVEDGTGNRVVEDGTGNPVVEG